MGTISTSLPSDGQTIDASDVNTPINAILSEFNGNIDDNNIKSGANINGSKLLASSIPGSKFDSSTQGGYTVGVLPAVSSVTENGNRSADITFASTVASILTPGMRIRTTRTVAAPTQCTSLNGTTQYYSKSSPNKLTFTDDFVVSVWVKLTSYATGAIVSRFNGTSGWQIYVTSTGQVEMRGYNASSGNNRGVSSYQSLPLNKWVHVAAQVDMSTYTLSTTTMYIMIDGVDVPCSLVQGGTNPTALIQAGNLEIGSNNGGSAFFPGKIAQVAIYNAKVTQATIRASKNQGLTGSETSLASAYSFNNSITDLNTTTPNDLTANGSALATNADSPFTVDANGTVNGTYDWAIVTKVATTVATVQYPEGCAIPTSGGISAVDYSGVKAPFGMPVTRNRWRISSQYTVRSTKASPVSGTTYNLGGEQITIPVGEWVVGYEATEYVISGAGTNSVRIDLNVTTATYTSTSDFASTPAYANTSTEIAGQAKKENELSLASQTIYYLNARCEFTGATNALSLLHDFNKGVIYAIPAHL
jgi:hypothetical protein